MPRNYKPVARLPRLCTLPSCGNHFTGNKGRRYCSTRCNLQHLKEKGRNYYDPVMAKRYLQKRRRHLMATSPDCSICDETVQRRSVCYKPIVAPVPKGIILCKKHNRGLWSFVRQNGYETMSVDDRFAAYLIRLTFTNSDRVVHMRMMREAFHANKQTQHRQAQYSPRSGS